MAATQTSKSMNLAVLLLIVGLSGCCGVIFHAEIKTPTFGIDYDNNTFVMDGKPFRYISGSIHYSRVPYQYWDDRLHKMAAAGLNAIQTYIPWNIHETVQGQYDFEGQQDIVTFFKTAQKYNLAVILRPGPYICAEWEFGGLPAWLLKDPSIKVRTTDPVYLKAVMKWMEKLYSVISPLLYKNGGPIITVQIENEYGSYPACDYTYLEVLRDLAWKYLGTDVVLFSTDGDGDGYLKCGTINGVYATVDFGITYHPEKNFAIQRHKEPEGPLVNSEYYTGWLDHWGQNHSTVPTAAVAKSLDLMLALGANVNMYMFEGGTNFGFWNGANYPYHPVPTSYDYDAPLTEAGDITDKYMQLRNTIAKYNPGARMKIPPSTPKYAYGKVQMIFVETVVSYVDGTSKPLSSKYPVNMESMDHYYGFVLYAHELKETVTDARIDLSGARDRAYVMTMSGNTLSSVGVVERDSGNATLTFSARADDSLFILVENQGRINYGGQMNNNLKGLISNVTLNGDNLTDWLNYPVNVESDIINKQIVKSSSSRMPALEYSIPSVYSGQLKIMDEPMDTYLDMSLWTKGQIFVNGLNLGRYWPHKGPQVRLYVPKYALKKGTNNIALIELEESPCQNKEQCYISFYDKPLINATVSPDVSHGLVPNNMDRMFYRGNLTFSEKYTGKVGSGRRQLSFFETVYDFVMKIVETKWGILFL
ncbi:beta-galactosidase-like isoform X2 [Mercenaria mercenaria]|uniref:beta-galactosidase-like isoform X2 n=1 Tax=Mercenaria mercenaria TaxID=6596 RepID=UPI00234F365C|nr:beta-galactosidase-like isoform X2 [Mercenaria mercenaria]